MNAPSTTDPHMRRAGAVLWLPCLAVALGAATATAHGLYQVAASAGVPGYIAWVYPLITDGLALVAYVSTARLAATGRRYAWTVVVLAAGLSGLAQAVNLSTTPDPGTAAGTGGHVVAQAAQVSGVLRFGVGAWPAIAAAIAAHLLFMLTAAKHPAGDETPNRDEPLPAASDPVTVQPPATVQPGPVVQPAPAVQKGVQPEPPTPVGHCPTSPPVGQPSVRRAVPGGERRTVSNGEPAPRDRARHAARRHHREHGAWPTVSQLMEAAGVSRGTAGTALQELRDHLAPLHVVQTSDQASTDQ
jgi:hypothetical protein